MYRVKMLDFNEVSKLEEEVNVFLASKDDLANFEVIDLKFNSYPYGEENTDYHSAMIIYKL